MFGFNPIGVGLTYTYLSGTTQNNVNPSSMKIQEQVNTAKTNQSSVNQGSSQFTLSNEPQLPTIREGVDPIEFAVRSRIKNLNNDSTLNAQESQKMQQTKSPQEVMEDAECQTCKKRKYQDGSDDPGVSYQTPTNIAPEQAASAVRGHEQEHVVREQAKAKREGREVVSQSVTIHTSICPECGDVYVSGGTTRTTTRASDIAQRFQQKQPESSIFQGVA